MKKEIGIVDALLSLRPGAQWTHYGGGYEDLVWNGENDLPAPTEEEIEQEIQKLKQNYRNTRYQRLRAKEYPTIEDQLDTLYHQGYDGWKKIIDEVKNKYPKQRSL